MGFEGKGAQRASGNIALIRIGVVVALAITFAAAANLGSLAAPTPGRAAGPRLKAVIIVGPSTMDASNLPESAQLATAAEAAGMEVHRVFTPHATWDAVVRAAQGANLLVYMGHGNGWPSPYAPFQTNTKDGLGLNAADGSRTVKYYGETPMEQSLHLAPHAVVLLNHLCYASGNGEPGMRIPTLDVAKQRVDNYAAGFLAIGASAVFAYGWESVADAFAGLIQPGHTMDQVFMLPSRYGYFGVRETRAPSVRTSGATMRLDPDPAHGYYRSVVGQLSMTTDQFLGGASVAPAPSGSPAASPAGTAASSPSVSPAPSTTAIPTTPPRATPSPTPSPVGGGTAVAARIDSFAAVAGSSAVTSTTPGPVMFTPNGDGITDTLALGYATHSAARLAVSVRDSHGTTHRRWVVTAPGDRGTTSWDGRSARGAVVGDGTYTLTATPFDASGVAGISRSTTARLLTAIASPAASPTLFYASDRDAYAPATVLTARVTHRATITWEVLDANGAVVARKLAGVSTPAGALSWRWDGRDARGRYVANGQYTATIAASTPAGWYAHRVGLNVGPFGLTASASAVRRGSTITYHIASAEPLSRLPMLHVTQPGFATYVVQAVRVGMMRYSATVRTRSGGSAGTLRVTVSGVDAGGQSQSAAFVTRLI